MENLERSKIELEKKLRQRTLELENSRKAILHMLKEMKEDVERLKEVDRLKTQFLSMVTHELKTPLTPIFEYVSLLKEKLLGPLTLKQEEAINSIQKQSTHLKNLIENILEISRIEVGKKLSVSKEPVSLERIIFAVEEMLAFDISRAGLTLEKKWEGEVPTLLGDENALKRVFINLIGNSLKFTPSGGKIVLEIKEEKGSVLILVEDSGIGIAAENLKKVFDKFYQVDVSYAREKGGIGMGLAIARALIEAHGGKIWAESGGLGRGAKFFVRLPISDRQ